MGNGAERHHSPSFPLIVPSPIRPAQAKPILCQHGTLHLSRTVCLPSPPPTPQSGSSPHLTPPGPSRGPSRPASRDSRPRPSAEPKSNAKYVTPIVIPTGEALVPASPAVDRLCPECAAVGLSQCIDPLTCRNNILKPFLRRVVEQTPAEFYSAYGPGAPHNGVAYRPNWRSWFYLSDEFYSTTHCPAFRRDGFKVTVKWTPCNATQNTVRRWHYADRGIDEMFSCFWPHLGRARRVAFQIPITLITSAAIREAWLGKLCFEGSSSDSWQILKLKIEYPVTQEAPVKKFPCTPQTAIIVMLLLNKVEPALLRKHLPFLYPHPASEPNGDVVSHMVHDILTEQNTANEGGALPMDGFLQHVCAPAFVDWDTAFKAHFHPTIGMKQGLQKRRYILSSAKEVAPMNRGMANNLVVPGVPDEAYFDKNVTKSRLLFPVGHDPALRRYYMTSILRSGEQPRPEMDEYLNNITVEVRDLSGSKLAIVNGISAMLLRLGFGFWTDVEQLSSRMDSSMWRNFAKDMRKNKAGLLLPEPTVITLCALWLGHLDMNQFYGEINSIEILSACRDLLAAYITTGPPSARLRYGLEGLSVVASIEHILKLIPTNPQHRDRMALAAWTPEVQGWSFFSKKPVTNAKYLGLRVLLAYITLITVVSETLFKEQERLEERTAYCGVTGVVTGTGGVVAAATMGVPGMSRYAGTAAMQAANAISLFFNKSLSRRTWHYRRFVEKVLVHFHFELDSARRWEKIKDFDGTPTAQDIEDYVSVAEQMLPPLLPQKNFVDDTTQRFQVRGSVSS